MEGSIAIIGGGMAGLACARRLARHGVSASIFDKGRGPGGRLSTRRSDDGAVRFDHGASYFSASHPGFLEQTRRWIDRGVASEWRARFAKIENRRLIPQNDETRYVGAPSMSAVVADMSRGLGVRWGVEVAPPVREGGAWLLRSVDGEPLGKFETCVAAVPAPQAARLFADIETLRRVTDACEMEAVWTTMAAFKRRLSVPFDAVDIAEGPIAWASRENSKQARGESVPDCWVMHADVEWTREVLENEPAEIAPRMLAAFQRLVNVRSGEPAHLSAHRWRYARTVRSVRSGAYFDGTAKVGLCGDWFLGARAEHAWLSGQALGDALLSAKN